MKRSCRKLKQVQIEGITKLKYSKNQMIQDQYWSSPRKILKQIYKTLTKLGIMKITKKGIQPKIWIQYSGIKPRNLLVPIGYPDLS